MKDFSCAIPNSNRPIDYYDLLRPYIDEYRGKEEIEKILFRYEQIEHHNAIVIDIIGKHDIRARGIRELHDISYLGLPEQTLILFNFFRDIFDSYVQERIKRGYISLKEIRSKKGALE